VSRGKWSAWRRAALPFVVGPRVIDLGCGTGRFVAQLSGSGFQAVGVDRSEAMLGQARRNTQGRADNTRLVRADLRYLPFPTGWFDTATLTFPTPVVRDPELWAELARVIRKAGRVVMVLTVRTPGTPLDRHDILEQATARGFRVECHDVAVEGRLVEVIVATLLST
jgi:ubiquinone/menaquinone biosynthesis C-methylase UbiE